MQKLDAALQLDALGLDRVELGLQFDGSAS